METFGDDKTIVVDGPPTFVCTGKGDNPHMFLQGVGSVSCNHCEETKCKLCVKEVIITSENSSRTINLCFSCYASHLNLDSDDEQIASKKQLRNELLKKHVDIPKEATYGVLKELHEEYVEKECLNMFKSTSSSILYPKYSSKEWIEPNF